jgi:tetratricopeptide (TPR) repeat protein
LVSSVVFYYGLLTYLRNFDWGNPVVFYEKIIKFSPASSQAHNNLGLEWEYRHNYDLAISEYKKALELNPESSVSRLNLANLYFNTEKYKEAKVQYDLLKRDASSLRLGEIENNIGCIYEIDGLWKSAEDSYKLALKLNPKLNFTHFNLAKIYQTQRKLDLCAQEIFASLPELKSFPQKSGQYLSFINTYIREVKIFNSKVFYEGLGVEFAKGGLPEAAVASFKRLLELEPYSSNVYYNLGLAYYQMGKRQEAIIFLNKAIEISPNHLQAKGFLRMATSAKQIKSK